MKKVLRLRKCYILFLLFLLVSSGAWGNEVFKSSAQKADFLKITQVIPAPGTTQVKSSSNITIMFNQPVIPLMAESDPRRSGLPHPLSFSPPIQGMGKWVNTSVYVFTPSQILEQETSYTGRINKEGLTTVTASSLEKDFSWQFTTGVDPFLEFTDSWPEDTQTGIKLDQKLRMFFNAPVDLASAKENIQLLTNGKKIPCKIEITAGGVNFIPKKPLSVETKYRFILKKGLRSAKRLRPLEKNHIVNFETVAFPRIIRTSADNMKSEDYFDGSFWIKFSAPVDYDSAIEHVEFDPPIKKPAYKYNYNSSSVTVTYDLKPAMNYTVKINPGITDPYGNKTTESKIIRFITGNREPSLSVMNNSKIGTLDAYQKIQLPLSCENVSAIHLKLYRLDKKEFIEATRYRRYWEDDYAPPKEMCIKEWQEHGVCEKNVEENRKIDLTFCGESIKPGMYFIESSAPEFKEEKDSYFQRRKGAFIVSKHNMTVKSNEDKIWVWVTDLKTGEPVKNVSLSTWGGDGKSYELQHTNHKGVACFMMPSYEDEDFDETYIISEPFCSLTSLDWDNGLQPWYFGLSSSFKNKKQCTSVYTDRNIYRAGQKVYFKGVYRDENDVQFSLPKEKLIKVDAVLTDSRGNEELRKTLIVDALGEFAGEFELPQDAKLGTYYIEIIKGGSDDLYTKLGFQVSAYRPPEFKVEVKPEKSAISSGQSLKAAVAVDYYFGGPVKEAPVEWTVFTKPYRFQAEQFARFDFTKDESPWRPYRPSRISSKTLLKGTGETDSAGRLSISIPGKDLPGHQRLSIEASIEGKDNQTISGRQDVIVHQGRYYIGSVSQKYINKANQPVKIDVVTVDWKGERAPNKTLDAKIYRREWESIYDKETEKWKNKIKNVFIQGLRVNTDSLAQGLVEFTPPKGGSYRIVLSGTDREGKKIESDSWIWVSGRNYVSWRHENNDRISLISDKSTYMVGETAEILIPSPYQKSHWAWITVERGGILSQKIIKLESNSSIVPIAISKEHTPNIFVSVVLVKGSDPYNPVASYKVGYIPLTVEARQQKLNVKITPHKKESEPGEKISLDIKVTDHKGQAVKTSLSLDVVDKAVLSLKPRKKNALFNEFYKKRRLGIMTSSSLSVSLNRMLKEEKSSRTQKSSKKTMKMSDGALNMRVASGVVEKETTIEIRENFSDTAFWKPQIITDSNGHARISVTLPDNLTTWEFRGIGITADTKIGETTVDVLSTRPLLVRPITPRFFVVGDEVELSALVNNNTGASKQVQVSLQSEGLDLLEGQKTQLVTIPSSGETKVVWKVKPQDVENVQIVMSARSGQDYDAAKPRLSTGPDGSLIVYRYSVGEVVGTAGQLITGGSRTEMVSLPADFDDRKGSLTVNLDPSLAAGMTKGLKYLEHFPYECTEQIISRFLPNIVNFTALKKLDIYDMELENKLRLLVEIGMSKLILRQRTDGGWPYWPRSRESNAYVSAYAVLALTKALGMDFTVDRTALERGVDFLKSVLLKPEDIKHPYQANKQAFMLYVMAEAGRKDLCSPYIDDFFDTQKHNNLHKLGNYGKAYLLMTLGICNPEDSRIKTLLASLQQEVKLSATGAHWEDEQRWRFSMNTDTRSTAIILSALIRFDKKNELIPNVVRWLMIARKDGRWETTQENAWAIMALSQWMVETGELKADYSYRMAVNGDEKAYGTIDALSVRESIKRTLDISELKTNENNKVQITRGEGPGRLYYSSHLNVYLPVDKIDALNQGIYVSRQYKKVNPGEEASQEIDINKVSVGDTVEVHLSIIAPQDLYYLVIEDPLPGGGEAIDPSLNTTSLKATRPTSKIDSDENSYYYWWRRSWHTRYELRDDKVVVFADRLRAGTYEFVYTFRATQAGQFKVIPTTANEFYTPEVYGRSKGRLLTISDK